MPLSVLLGLSEKAQQRVKETQQLFFDIRETAAQSPNVPSTDSLWRKNLEITGHLLVENWEKRRKKKSLEVSTRKWKCSKEILAMPSGGKGFGRLPPSSLSKLELHCLLQEKEDPCRLKINSRTTGAQAEQSRWRLQRGSSGMLRSLWVSSD